MITAIIGAIAITVNVLCMFKHYMERDLLGVLVCGILLIGVLIARM